MDLFKETKLDPRTIQEIKKLHFQTRRLADRGIVGSYRSAFRGTGIEFEEVREYSPGDEIRSIDWKVTARSGKPYVKSYREERELSVIIAVDVSASTLTGTQRQLRDTLIAKIGAILTLTALINNDKVGLITYSDRLETYHPPRKARSAVWRILHEVLEPRGYRPCTDLGGLFSFMNGVLKKRAIVFVISDFLDENYEKPLQALTKRHDVTAIIITDPADFDLPEASLVRVHDPESGVTSLLDTSDPKTRIEYQDNAGVLHSRLNSIFRKHGVGILELRTDKPFIYALREFFDNRRRSLHRYWR